MSARKRHWAAAVFVGAGTACLSLAASAILSSVAVSPARADSGIFNPSVFDTTDGRQIFEQICQGCHMPNAQGAVGAGRYPALANDRALGSRQYMAVTILLGRRNMPAFGGGHAIGLGGSAITLNKEQIAAVINYVRTHFGNRYTDPITAVEIAALDHGAH